MVVVKIMITIIISTSIKEGERERERERERQSACLGIEQFLIFDECHRDRIQSPEEGSWLAVTRFHVLFVCNSKL